MILQVGGHLRSFSRLHIDQPRGAPSQLFLAHKKVAGTNPFGLALHGSQRASYRRSLRPSAFSNWRVFFFKAALHSGRLEKWIALSHCGSVQSSLARFRMPFPTSRQSCVTNSRTENIRSLPNLLSGKQFWKIGIGFA